MSELTIIIVVAMSVGAVIACTIALERIRSRHRAPLHTENTELDRTRSASADEDKHVQPSPPQQQPQPQQPERETAGGARRSIHDIKNTDAVKQWLLNEVKLPQYEQAFISNGYETMEIVKEIRSEDQLQEIGIESQQHQHIILSKIHVLRGEDSVHLAEKQLSEGVHVVVATDAGDQDDVIESSSDENVTRGAVENDDGHEKDKEDEHVEAVNMAEIGQHDEEVVDEDEDEDDELEEAGKWV